MNFVITFFLACTSEKTNDTSKSDTFVPTMPISECGLPDYEFLPIEEMGTLLSSDKREDLSLDKDALTALLDNFELPLPPPENGIETYYIEYQSQDKGQLSNGTGMIILPENTTEAPVLVWLHPTMGFNDECSPTATGVIGAAYPAIFASLGFIVVAPDYIGMRGWTGESEDLHAYASAEATAIFSIDSLRALPNLLKAYNKEILWNDQEIILWGVSEGGFAALATDRYFPHYAPEFTTLTTVASTPVTDVFALAQHGMSEFSDTSAGVLGVALTLNQWYEANLDLETILQPEFISLEQSMLESCDDFDDLNNVTEISQVFQQSFIDGILSDDNSVTPWDCIFKDNNLTTKIPHIQTAPTLIVTAEFDDLAWAPPVHTDIPVLCEEGYEIVHRQCAQAGHVSGSLDSLGEQWAWIQARLNNEPLSNTCIVAEPISCGE